MRLHGRVSTFGTPGSDASEQARTDTPAIRAKNQAILLRASIVANVMERLDVYAALTIGAICGVDTQTRIRREHAERIVEAVLALSATTDMRV